MSLDVYSLLFFRFCLNVSVFKPPVGSVSPVPFWTLNKYLKQSNGKTSLWSDASSQCSKAVSAGGGKMRGGCPAKTEAHTGACQEVLSAHILKEEWGVKV